MAPFGMAVGKAANSIGHSLDRQPFMGGTGLLLQVAFFLPQLVQQLRGDEGGLIRQFLLDAAKRSRLFAHHLVKISSVTCLRVAA
jgi:hypothetical protein